MNQEGITSVPDIPDTIVEAINIDRFAVFLGAGVSMLVGCSSWKDLGINLINRCLTTPSKQDKSRNCINFKEKDRLFAELNSPKKVITICKQILEENDKLEVFYDELEKSVKPKEKLVKSQNIYTLLDGLHGLFLTTNIDTHFHTKYHKSQIVFRELDFNPSNIDRTKLYHLHGLIEDKDTIVLTVPDYFLRYNNPVFKEFLSRIFSEYSVLFIGYGMNEFEILDFLITKYYKKIPEKPAHFILLPYFRGDDAFVRFDRTYYRLLGIEVLPFASDEKGHEQLYEIIENWKKEISQTSRYLYDTIKILEDAANNYDEEIEKKVFQLIKNDKTLEFEFFKNLGKTNNPLPWLQPVIKYGYLDPSHNPSPDEKSWRFWGVLSFIQNVALHNYHSPRPEITNCLVELIERIINFKGERHERIENPLTDRTIIKIIFLLPLEKIGYQHYDFIKICLNSKYDSILIANEISDHVITRIIDENSSINLLKILDIILDYKKSEEPSFEHYVSVLGTYYLSSILKKNLLKIIEISGIDAAKIALSNIKSIIDEGESQFVEAWIPIIPPGKSEELLDDRYDYQLVQLVWEILRKAEKDDVRILLKELLTESHSIFKRIALSIINSRYVEMQDLLWTWDGNPLDEIELKPELYALFANNCHLFNKPNIKQVLLWIETKSYYIPRDIEGDQQKIDYYLAYKKKGWISSLLTSKDPDVLLEYDKYNSINPTELRVFSRNIIIETISDTVTPTEKENLLVKSNQEIVRILNKLDIQSDKSNQYLPGHLSEVFRACVVENPQKFSEDIEPFLEIKREYQYELLLGFSEGWRSGKKFGWNNVLNFILMIVENHDFWLERSKEENPNYNDWIVSEIGTLIYEGTSNENNLLNLELLPNVKRILLILSRNVESDLRKIDDYTTVYNTSKGRIYLALMSYSMVFAGNFRRDQKKKWDDDIRIELERCLNTECDSIEFSAVRGQYINKLCYIDQEWVVGYINQIFPKERELLWSAAFGSYLSFTNVYVKLYNLLKKNSHYLTALTSNFKEMHANEKLVQHICIGYVNELEKLDNGDSLISRLVNSGEISKLSEIIRYFYYVGAKLPEERKNLIKPLWGAIYSIVIQHIDQIEYQNLLAELSTWMSIIDTIDDEIFIWLKESAKYIKIHQFSYVENLIKHAQQKPHFTGLLFLSTIENGVFFEFEKEAIQKFVGILFESGEKQLGNRICNIYLQAGFDFLKRVFEKYNS